MVDVWDGWWMVVYGMAAVRRGAFLQRERKLKQSGRRRLALTFGISMRFRGDPSWAKESPETDEDEE